MKSELERETRVRQEYEAKVRTVEENLTSTTTKSQQLINALQAKNKELNTNAVKSLKHIARMHSVKVQCFCLPGLISVYMYLVHLRRRHHVTCSLAPPTDAPGAAGARAAAQDPGSAGGRRELGGRSARLRQALAVTAGQR